jgi:hypothetical protein
MVYSKHENQSGYVNNNIIFQSDSDITGLRNRILECGIDTPYCYPIWIDFLGTDDDEEKRQIRDFDVDAAIVLYNFAILYTCEAQGTQQCGEALIAAKQRALHLFELAISVLTRRACLESEELLHNERQTLMVFLLSRSLYQLYSDLECHHQAITSRLALVTIWESIDDHYVSLELFEDYTRPTGASAA